MKLQQFKQQTKIRHINQYKLNLCEKKKYYIFSSQKVSDPGSDGFDCHFLTNFRNGGSFKYTSLHPLFSSVDRAARSFSRLPLKVASEGGKSGTTL